MVSHTPTAFVPKEDKITRLHAQSARIEAGHVLLPQQAAWLEELRPSSRAFRRGGTMIRSIASVRFLAWHFGRRGMGLRVIRLGGI